MHQEVPRWHRASIGPTYTSNQLDIPGILPELQYHRVGPKNDKSDVLLLRPVKLSRSQTSYDQAGRINGYTAPQYTSQVSLSSSTLPRTPTKSSTLDNSFRPRHLSLPNEYPTQNGLLPVSDSTFSGSLRSIKKDKVHSILTRIPCDPPKEFIQKLKQNEEGSVILQLLESQKQEAAKLAEDHRQLHAVRQANELSQLADRCAYNIALFNRRIQQQKPIPYCFELIDLPQSNINISVPNDVLEVNSLCGLNYRRPVDASGALSTYVQLELPYPSSIKAQRIRSDWVKTSGDFVDYHSSLHFKISNISPEYADFLDSENQLKVTVFYARNLVKRSGTLGSVRFTLRELLHFATVSLSGDLVGQYGEITGRLKLQLKQKQSVMGKVVNVVRKPWLFLAVPEIPCKSLSQTVGRCPMNLRSTPSILDGETLINRDKTATALSEEITKSLESAIIYNKHYAVKLSTIGEKMDVLYSQFKGNQIKRNDMQAYLKNLCRMLQQFKAKQEEAKYGDDQKAMRFYVRREKLILRELERYGLPPSEIEKEVSPISIGESNTKFNGIERDNDSRSIYSSIESLQVCGSNGDDAIAPEPVSIRPTNKDIIIINGQDSTEVSPTFTKTPSLFKERTVSFPDNNAVYLDFKRIGEPQQTNAMTNEQGERIIYV